MMQQARHEAHVGQVRNAHTIFVRKPEGKGPLGRHRHRWGNTRLNFRKAG
jgi:hypothetical protein